jgi:hypothetical protein
MNAPGGRTRPAGARHTIDGGDPASPWMRRSGVYVRYDETEGGTVQPVAKPVRVARQRPFAKELELLKELGLR